MEVVLDHRVTREHVKILEFVEKEPEQTFKEEPGLKKFLRDIRLSGDINEEEVKFLKKLRFNTKRPTPLYYYRELQNLRDPLHFRTR
jgi:hypothetical protein